MNNWDRNRRIYECLKEIYNLTHLPDVEQLGERSEPNSEPSQEFDPLGINNLDEFILSPEKYKGRWPEEVILP